MTRTWQLVPFGLFLLSCGDDTDARSCSECEALEAELRQEAERRGLASQGLCNLPWGEPGPYEDDPGFKEHCAEYEKCIDECE